MLSGDSADIDYLQQSSSMLSSRYATLDSGEETSKTNLSLERLDGPKNQKTSYLDMNKRSHEHATGSSPLQRKRANQNDTALPSESDRPRCTTGLSQIFGDHALEIADGFDSRTEVLKSDDEV